MPGLEFNVSKEIGMEEPDVVRGLNTSRHGER